MEHRVLMQTFEIRYTDGKHMLSGNCTPDALPDVLKQLMDEGNRIEQVNSKWI
jgi:hypothetical protein